MHAHLVAVLLVFDIHDVLLFQELAIVVDFVLQVQRAVRIHLLRIVKHSNHVH